MWTISNSGPFFNGGVGGVLINEGIFADEFVYVECSGMELYNSDGLSLSSILRFCVSFSRFVSFEQLLSDGFEIEMSPLIVLPCNSSLLRCCFWNSLDSGFLVGWKIKSGEPKQCSFVR
jgi:hypothetical protein